MNENRRLGFIKSLHIKLCSLQAVYASSMYILPHVDVFEIAGCIANSVDPD